MLNSDINPQIFHFLNPLGAANEFVQISLHHESCEFLLCTLQHGKLLQQPLDMIFNAGEEIAFSLNGKGLSECLYYFIK